MPTAIKIQNLIKTYSNGVQALKGVDLTVESGDFFALLGANGAGKTTIISILTGLTNKTSGNVEVFGHDIDHNFPEAKQTIGVVPQEFNFNMFEKVLDIMVNQAGYYGISADIATPRAKELLVQLGLGDKMDKVSRTLSGGMKRRLMIARALIHSPKMLILDEPTAGVDVELRIGMWDYLRTLNEKEGVTILLTTHYLEEVEQLCKNAAIIKQGEIIKNDTVKNLLKSLDQETYLIDVEKTHGAEKIEGYSLQIVDENTLEVILKKEQSLNDLIAKLSQNQIIVHSIRPKGNRLEELFMNVLKN